MLSNGKQVNGNANELVVPNGDLEPQVNVLEKYLKFGRYQLLCSFIFYAYYLGTQLVQSHMGFGGAKPTHVTCVGQNGTEMLAWSNDVCAELGGPSCLNYTLTGNFWSIQLEYGLVCDRLWIVHAITTLQMCGVGIGVIVFGRLSDRFGRRRIALTAWTLVLTLQSLYSFMGTWHWAVFGVFRFFLGMTGGGLLTSGYTFFCELQSTSDRYTVLSLTAFPLAYVWHALIAWLAGSWEKLSSYGVIVQLPFYGMLWVLCDESPRWLIQKGHVEAGIQALERITGFNGLQFDKKVMETEIHEQEQRTQILNKHKTDYTFRHLFYTTKLTKYTIALCFMWFSVSLLNYSIMFNVSGLSGNLYANAIIFGATGWIFQQLCNVVDRKVAWVGRRQMIGIVNLITVVFLGLCIVIQIINLSAQSEALVISNRWLALLAGGMMGPGWMLIYLLPAELYPTPIRNVANGSMSFCARVGAGIAPQLVLIGEFWPPALALLPMIFTVIGGTLCFLWLDETKNKPMPEHMPEKESTPSP